jgi:hypothetical protein
MTNSPSLLIRSLPLHKRATGTGTWFLINRHMKCLKKWWACQGKVMVPHHQSTRISRMKCISQHKGWNAPCRWTWAHKQLTTPGEVLLTTSSAHKVDSHSWVMLRYGSLTHTAYYMLIICTASPTIQITSSSFHITINNELITSFITLLTVNH